VKLPWVSRELFELREAFYAPLVVRQREEIDYLRAMLSKAEDRYERLVDRMTMPPSPAVMPRVTPIKSEPDPALPQEVQDALGEWASDPFVHAHLTNMAMLELRKPHADAADVARRIREGETVATEMFTE
jgi:hypothetical protein